MISKAVLDDVTDADLGELYESLFEVLGQFGKLEEQHGYKPNGWFIGLELFFEAVEAAMLLRPGTNAARVPCLVCGAARVPDLPYCTNADCADRKGFSRWVQ